MVAKREKGVLKVLPYPKYKASGGIGCKPITVINSKNRIKNLFIDQTESYSRIDMNVLCLHKVAQRSSWMSPRTDVSKDICL